MGILVKVGETLQRLFGEIAETAAEESGVIQRTRKFTAISLARTFVLGFLRTPTASDEKFLRSGALSHVEIEPGRSPDGATSRQAARHGKGALRIADLGYFALAVFAAMAEAGEYYLSRLQFGTNVLLHPDTTVEVLRWLVKQPGPFVDAPILLGQSQHLPCRLIAWRLPCDQADRRRRKLRQETMKKRGREPCAERLAWCDWTILVTNVPGDLLTPAEATVSYRARWQNCSSNAGNRRDWWQN